MTRIASYLSSERGASTAEFALVLPILLFIFLGMLQFGMLLYTASQLHWITEDAARCASVRLTCRVGGVATGAVNSTTVSAYASSRYTGLSPATFTYAATGACGPGNTGKTVTGTSTYRVNLGVLYRTVVLNSTACFP